MEQFDGLMKVSPFQFAMQILITPVLNREHMFSLLVLGPESVSSQQSSRTSILFEYRAHFMPIVNYLSFVTHFVIQRNSWFANSRDSPPPGVKYSLEEPQDSVVIVQPIPQSVLADVFFSICKILPQDDLLKNQCMSWANLQNLLKIPQGVLANVYFSVLANYYPQVICLKNQCMSWEN